MSSVPVNGSGRRDLELWVVLVALYITLAALVGVAAWVALDFDEQARPCLERLADICGRRAP